MQHAVLAIDVGSTRLKAALVADDGSTLASHAADSPLRAAVVQAADVLDAVLAVARAVCVDCAEPRPAAIAITGATRTHVLTGADGQALAALVKLDDARGTAFEAEVQAAYGEPARRGLGAFHPLARLLDIKATQPAAYAAARWQLELKDWLNLQLTGAAATDEVTRSRDAPAQTPQHDAMRRLGLRAELFPPSLAPGRVIGAVAAGVDTRFAPWHGVPVVQCGFDAWCASYGMGCVRERHVYNVSGTTEVFGSFSRDDRPLPGIGSLRWAPELFHLGGPCLTGLATLAWFGRTFLNHADPQGVLDCASRAGDDTPLCLPFVAGERMPFWRADLSAQFLEVRSAHGLPEFARALVDGLLAFQRYLISLMCPDATTVHLSGGATLLRGWNPLKASMFDRPVLVCDRAEPSLAGCAMAAFTAIGEHASMAEAQLALKPTYQQVEPDAAAARRLRQVEQKLRPFFLEESRRVSAPVVPRPPPHP